MAKKSPTKLYLLPADKFYYNNEWHCYRKIGDIFPKGLYRRAYSKKQVYNYMIRDIAVADKSYYSDIFIDIYDIIEVVNENEKAN